MDHGLGASDHSYAGHHHQDHDGLGGDISEQALFIAYGLHGGNSHFSFDCPGAHTDYVHSDHVASAAMDRQGANFLLDSVPTTYDDGTVVRGYAVHVAKHSQVAFLTRFQQVARDLGLIPLDLRPGLEPSSSLVYEILALDAWEHLEELNGGIKRDVEIWGARANSLGWYPGATGRTQLFRQKWQIGKRTHSFAQPAYDGSAHTYLELAVVQWTYLESCDFETLMELRIISQLEWDPTQGIWTYLRKPFQSHQRAAIELYKQMTVMLLSDARPSELSLRMRALVEPSADTTDGLVASQQLSAETQTAGVDSSVDESSEIAKESDAGAGTADVTIDLEEW